VSLHADATAVLSGWQPPDPAQASLREAYLRHLRRHPDGVWRGCRPDHLTASALVLSADRARVLLTLHGKVRRWLQLGGHCEPADATLAAAARREAVEESGIADLVLDEAPVLLSHHEVPCGPVLPAHHLDVQYVAHAPADAEAVRSAESEDLRWFAVDALPDDTDDSVRALVQHALRRGRLSRGRPRRP
jgi:8-oxo-dGTP pyrophosphatase MutT (NUDIX family)